MCTKADILPAAIGVLFLREVTYCYASDSLAEYDAMSICFHALVVSTAIKMFIAQRDLCL